MRTKTLIPLISFLVLLLLFDVSCGMKEDNNAEEDNSVSSKVDEEDTPFEMKRKDWEDYLITSNGRFTKKNRGVSISIKAKDKQCMYPEEYVPEVKGHSVAKRTLWKKIVSDWLTIMSKENNVVIMEPFGGMGVHIDVQEDYDNTDMSKMTIESGSIVAAYEAAFNLKKESVKIYIGEFEEDQEKIVRATMDYVRKKAPSKIDIRVERADFTKTRDLKHLLQKQYSGYHALMMVDPYKMNTAPMDSLEAFFSAGESGTRRTLITNFFVADVLRAFVKIYRYILVDTPKLLQASQDALDIIHKVMGTDDFLKLFQLVDQKARSMYRGEYIQKWMKTGHDVDFDWSEWDDSAKLSRVLANVHRELLIERVKTGEKKIFTGEKPTDVAFISSERDTPMYIAYCLTTIDNKACDAFDRAVKSFWEDDHHTFRRSYGRNNDFEYAKRRARRYYAYFKDHTDGKRRTTSADSNLHNGLRFKEKRDEDNDRVLSP